MLPDSVSCKQCEDIRSPQSWSLTAPVIRVRPIGWSPVEHNDIEGNTKRVFQYVLEHPGCYLRQIRRELEISMGTTQYHTDLLEKAGRLTSSRHGLYKHYFVSGVFHDDEKNLLGIFGHETARDILLFIAERRNPTQSEIAKGIGVSAPSISWHVKRLVESHVISEVTEGKYKRYGLRGDPQRLVSLMKSYFPSLWDKWSDRLAEMFLSLSGDEEG